MAVFPEAGRLINCGFDYRTRAPESIQKSRAEHREVDSPSQQRWPTVGQNNSAKVVSFVEDFMDQLGALPYATEGPCGHYLL